MRPARLGSLAHELAAAPVDDLELAAQLGIARDRVASLSQGRLRTFAPDGVGPADLAVPAARRALEQAGLGPADVDLIIFSTNTPDYTFPGSACLLQAALGCPPVGCLDVRAVCAGFVVAVDLARRYIGSGTYERVVVAAAEVPSHQNRFDGIAPELTCLTGDAACVTVVVPGEGEMQLLGASARHDGNRHRLLWCEFPASRHLEGAGVVRGTRLTRAAIVEGRIYPVADFDGLRAAALSDAPGVLEDAMHEANVDVVDALIVAHVDPRTERELAARLGKRARRSIAADFVYAYSASLPLALARARERGAVAAGDTVALVTAGGGASWGALIMRL